MSAAQDVSQTGGSDICMTMVELSLAQLSPSVYDSCAPVVTGFDDSRLLDVDVPVNYHGGHVPLVTHPVSYVTDSASSSETDFIPTCSSLLDFHLDPARLSSAFPLHHVASVPTSTNPTTALSRHRPLVDCVQDMSYPAVLDACDPIAAVSRRKKAVPRRHGQTTANKLGAVLPSPVDTGPKQLMDDYARLVEYVPQCLERFGFCVVDKFAGKPLALSVRNEVVSMYECGLFEDGLLTSQAFAVTAVRGDRVYWLEQEDDAQCAGISQLIRRLDDLFLRLRGCLGSCHISSRSKVSFIGRVPVNSSHGQLVTA